MDSHTTEDCEQFNGTPSDVRSPTSVKSANKCGDDLQNKNALKTAWGALSWLDRVFSLLIILSMVLGVLIGIYAPNAKETLAKGRLKGTSAPISVGLIIMMWPILTKVEFECIPTILRSRRLWTQVLVSLPLNWIMCPFLMLSLAWATLPDLQSYRIGIIMVGIARCIAMVMIWIQIAQGDTSIAVIILIINSLLQIVLYAPMSVFFVNIISGSVDFKLNYSDTAISVIIYLGIPLCAGIITRFFFIFVLGKHRFEKTFLRYFEPLSAVALIYTIIIIFAEQAKGIIANLGPFFRTMVPLVLYFTITWGLTFYALWWLSVRYGKGSWGYELAVVQSFTVSSNNFELAIAVCVSVYGADSDQTLAATMGPLVEVPVLLTLAWFSLYLKHKLEWDNKRAESVNRDMVDSRNNPQQKEYVESLG